MVTLRAPDVSSRLGRGGDEPAPRRHAAIHRAESPSAPSILTTCWPAVAGSLLAFAAFPPVDFWPLAWFAPVLWLLAVRRRELTGKRPYGVLWLAGFAFWFPVLHWLRLPDKVTIIGWFALSIYLAFYLPTSVAICRVAIHRLRVPLIVAAPVTWAGLELAQSHLLTGFNMASLAHSQWRWLPLIQIADLAGGYAVTFLIIFVAACLTMMLPLEGRHAAWWPLMPTAAALAVVLGYGYWRLDHAVGRPGPTIALIQGSIDTELKLDPVKQGDIYPHYFGLSKRAVAGTTDLDLIVWPETMFRNSLLSCPTDVKSPVDWPRTLGDVHREIKERRWWISHQAELLDTPLLLGIEYIELGSTHPRRFNSALFVNRQGEIGPRYDKMHPVLFGEYVPFAKQLPWLASLSPIGAGIDWGTDVPEFQVAGARLAANICYESAIPHVIRRQVTHLRQEGKEPDILVNLTNDGWFRGSSELDLHLICAVFRAIECRKPFLIAANTGFSAWIDADGRVIEQGPRRTADVIIAHPTLDNRRSLYMAWGDLPAGICLTATCAVGLVGLWDRFRRRRLMQ
jgi:apolipoprotein N-acyltransferase